MKQHLIDSQKLASSEACAPSTAVRGSEYYYERTLEFIDALQQL